MLRVRNMEVISEETPFYYLDLGKFFDFCDYIRLLISLNVKLTQILIVFDLLLKSTP